MLRRVGSSSTDLTACVGAGSALTAKSAWVDRRENDCGRHTKEDKSGQPSGHLPTRLSEFSPGPWFYITNTFEGSWSRSTAIVRPSDGRVAAILWLSRLREGCDQAPRGAGKESALRYGGGVLMAELTFERRIEAGHYVGCGIVEREMKVRAGDDVVHARPLPEGRFGDENPLKNVSKAAVHSS